MAPRFGSASGKSRIIRGSAAASIANEVKVSVAIPAKIASILRIMGPEFIGVCCTCLDISCGPHGERVGKGEHRMEHSPTRHGSTAGSLHRPWLVSLVMSVRQPETLPHYPMVLHRGGFPDGS